MSSTILRQLASRTKVPLEQRTGLDGQGMPEYSEAVEVGLVIRRSDEEALDGSGTRIRTELSIWVPEDETPVPKRGDRFEFEGDLFIVETTKRLTGMKGQVLFHRLQARRE